MDNRGMMTVEAACIVPIILMIIVIEIFFGIFLIEYVVSKERDDSTSR